MKKGWQVLDEEAGVLWTEYLFTKGALATTFTFRGKDGGLVVVSPPIGVDDRAYDALREHGEVRALVANNGMHTLGLAPWKKRFPDATCYAPPGAIPRLQKKAGDFSYESVEDLPLPAGVACELMPGFKTGETFVRVDTKSKGRIWFTGDLFGNHDRLPPWPLKWLFSWTDSAPGLKLFVPVTWIAVKDKKALRQGMLDTLAKDPPRVIVPSHGAPADVDDIVGETRAQLERL